MKDYKTGNKNIEVMILTKVKCDRCDAEISHKDQYYEATSGHHLWGADSHDSIDTHEFCSTKCVSKSMRNYFEDVNKEETHYFNVISTRLSLEKNVL